MNIIHLVPMDDNDPEGDAYVGHGATRIGAVWFHSGYWWSRREGAEQAVRHPDRAEGIKRLEGFAP